MISIQVLSSLTLDQVCLLLRTIEGINTAMADTYCASVVSSNITGQVPLQCNATENYLLTLKKYFRCCSTARWPS